MLPQFIAAIAPAELLAPPSAVIRLSEAKNSITKNSTAIFEKRRVEEQLYGDASTQFDMAARLRGTSFAARPMHTAHQSGRNRQ